MVTASAIGPASKKWVIAGEEEEDDLNYTTDLLFKVVTGARGGGGGTGCGRFKGRFFTL